LIYSSKEKPPPMFKPMLPSAKSIERPLPKFKPISPSLIIDIGDSVGVEAMFSDSLTTLEVTFSFLISGVTVPALLLPSMIVLSPIFVAPISSTAI
jgi:hypothetical protein